MDDPYERWRQAVWIAGVVISILLTAAILILIFIYLVGRFGAPAGS